LNHLYYLCMLNNCIYFICSEMSNKSSKSKSSLPVWTAPAGYSYDLNTPIYDHFPDIKRPSVLARTMASVHWSDGEAAQLAALQSRCFNTAVSDLSLRLCKLNPSRSGAEQPWDLAKSFMSGHTQVKQGTHELRPISASIKVCLS